VTERSDLRTRLREYGDQIDGRLAAPMRPDPSVKTSAGTRRRAVVLACVGLFGAGGLWIAVRSLPETSHTIQVVSPTDRAAVDIAEPENGPPTDELGADATSQGWIEVSANDVKLVVDGEMVWERNLGATAGKAVSVAVGDTTVALTKSGEVLSLDLDSGVVLTSTSDVTGIGPTVGDEIWVSTQALSTEWSKLNLRTGLLGPPRFVAGFELWPRYAIGDDRVLARNSGVPDAESVLLGDGEAVTIVTPTNAIEASVEDIWWLENGRACRRPLSGGDAECSAVIDDDARQLSSTDAAALSPNNSALVLVAKESDTSRENELAILDIATLEVLVSIDDLEQPLAIHWSPDGLSVVLSTRGSSLVIGIDGSIEQLDVAGGVLVIPVRLKGKTDAP